MSNDKDALVPANRDEEGPSTSAGDGDAPSAEMLEGLILRAERTISSYESPIPPPHVLEAYNQVVPGAAERLLSEAEAQGRHRRELEQMVIRGDDRRADLGLRYSFIIGVGLIVLTAFLTVMGEPAWGVALILFAIGAVTAVYVGARIDRRRQLREKSDNWSD